MFHIVSPGRNSERFVHKHLASTLNQEYTKPYRVTWIDDASVDDSVLSAIDQPGPNDSQRHLVDWRLRANTRRLGGLHNLIETVRSMDPEDIVVICSADDYLSPFALERVEREYMDDAWLTYGQYKRSDGVMGHCRPYERGANFRQLPFFASHLITFKAWLFNCIDEEDLRDVDGEFYKTCADMAFMLPMLELCETSDEMPRAHFIPDILLTYNLHDQCDHVVDRANQLRVDKRVRAQEDYRKRFS